MKLYRLVFIVFALAALNSCVGGSHRAGNSWIALFDGSDIEQWDVIEGGEWTIEGDVLVGRNGKNWSTNPEKTGSYLRTKRTYGDFELSLEYAISEKGNSGVMFRSAAEKNPSFTGYEMQITDCYGRDVNQKNSGIYDVVGLSENAIKPAGEWNHAVIYARGHYILMTVNGVRVVEHVGDRRLEGYIGLQNHDERAVVKFKNIRIREL